GQGEGVGVLVHEHRVLPGTGVAGGLAPVGRQRRDEGVHHAIHVGALLRAGGLLLLLLELGEGLRAELVEFGLGDRADVLPASRGRGGGGAGGERRRDREGQQQGSHGRLLSGRRQL